MTRKDASFIVPANPGFGLNVALKFCFLMLFGVLLGRQQSFASAETSSAALILPQDIPALLRADVLHTDRYHFFFEIPTTPQGIESFDDDEREDFDDNGTIPQGLYTIERLIGNLFTCNSFTMTGIAQMSYSVKNQQATPFFILYHSWKSFIS